LGQVEALKKMVTLPYFHQLLQQAVARVAIQDTKALMEALVVALARVVIGALELLDKEMMEAVQVLLFLGQAEVEENLLLAQFHLLTP
jgi:hypothetical protein